MSELLLLPNKLKHRLKVRVHLEWKNLPRTCCITSATHQQISDKPLTLHAVNYCNHNPFIPNNAKMNKFSKITKLGKFNKNRTAPQ